MRNPSVHAPTPEFSAAAVGLQLEDEDSNQKTDTSTAALSLAQLTATAVGPASLLAGLENMPEFFAAERHKR